MKNLTKFTFIITVLSTMLTSCKAIDENVSKVTINRIETNVISSDTNYMETQTLWIAPFLQQNCLGVTTMKCLKIQQATAESSEPVEEAWQNFYQDIEGFQWQEGQLSKIKVALIPVNQHYVYSDDSSVRYKLIEVLQ